MNQTLEGSSDQELAEIFAVEVAGYIEGKHPISGKIYTLDEEWELPEDLEFATSVDALLPHMEQQRLSILRSGYSDAIHWNVYSQNPICGEVRDKSLARAICMMLILVARAELKEDRARHRSETPPHCRDD